ncbi:hypothetical protein F3Y22_tig00110770pilonHSYRG00069 [Hibiscus syriacus]|uniref:TIR domain-containing protein n=1 Tax=Hibiscus syriacus TaxID=106335 RepID=A0A6A2ZTH5_HIBSY|nr:hypothetical protein F3Y22_tig00110770pilonHSYRG00069 [Hibiscus syriacus]
MAASYSSSCPMKHQVFLSFRGEDTRLNFTAHLLQALEDKGISVFFDEKKLERGEQLSQALSNAIAASNISLIVLSEDYASSKSCLAELCDIMDRKHNQKHIVLPVFYHVNPSHVRHLGGTFKTSFEKHESEALKQVDQWKKAFAEVDLKPSTSRRLLMMLPKKLRNSLPSPSACDLLVGTNYQKNLILGLIEKEESRVIGLWGPGGIGKTTLADAVFHENSSKFDDRYFLQNVRQNIEKQGRESIRNELLSKLLNENDLRIDTLSIGSPYRERLNSKKVFVVLDDVSHPDQIDFMGVGHFGRGSKIILTSRDRRVLYNGGAEEIHEVNKLDKDHSLHLFSTFAFKQLNPDPGFEALSNKFVEYADGSPLALKVLGSQLYKKSKQDWESEVRKPEKDIFLDIACFFKGESKEEIEEILSCLYEGAVCGINNLLDKCLLDITLSKTIYMHDMLEEMGKDIVRQESKDPGNRSRLWNIKDIDQVLKYNEMNKSIEGIKLSPNRIKDVMSLCPSGFANMLNLRYIHINSYFTVFFDKLLADNVDSVSLPNELRYLYWMFYPFKSVSPSFNPKNLIVLKLHFGGMEQLWNEDSQDLVNLKIIELICCKKLRKIPNLSGAINLQSLICTRCKNLVELPRLNHLASLEKLDLSGCMTLRKIPSLSGAINLKLFNCNDCVNLVELPCLNHLASLKSFEFERCHKLKKFPELPNIFSELDFSHTEIEVVPDSIQHLVGLKKLKLSYSKVEHVSSNISKLGSLRELDLDHCESLKTLPKLPLYLWRLDASNCRSLTKVSFTTHNFNSSHDGGDGAPGEETISMSFVNCRWLDQNSIKNIGANVMLRIQSLAQRWSRRKGISREEYRDSFRNLLFCCFPGNEVSTDVFFYGSMNNTLNLKIRPNGFSGNRFLAFAVCLVADLTPANVFLAFICKYQLKSAGGKKLTGECYVSDHGWDKFYEGDFALILFNEDMIVADNDYEEASFEFYISSSRGTEIKVEKCGVRVFYVDAESYTINDVVGNQDLDSEEGDGGHRNHSVPYLFFVFLIFMSLLLIKTKVICG